MVDKGLADEMGLEHKNRRLLKPIAVMFDFICAAEVVRKDPYPDFDPPRSQAHGIKPSMTQRNMPKSNGRDCSRQREAKMQMVGSTVKILPI